MKAFMSLLFGFFAHVTHSIKSLNSFAIRVKFNGLLISHHFRKL